MLNKLSKLLLPLILAFSAEGRDMRILFSEKNDSRKVLDENTGKRPYWVRGDDIEIEAAFKKEDGTFLLASDVTSIEFVVRGNSENEASPKLMTNTIGSADCDDEFQASDWKAGDDFTTVSWERALCNLDVPDGQSSQIYLIYAVHTDGNGRKTTYGSYEVEVRRAPHATTTLATPDPPEEVPLTITQGDARYQTFDYSYSKVEADSLFSSSSEVWDGIKVYLDTNRTNDEWHANDATARVGDPKLPFRTWEAAAFVLSGTYNNRQPILVCAPGTVTTSSSIKAHIHAPFTNFVADSSTTTTRGETLEIIPTAANMYLNVGKVSGVRPFGLNRSSGVDNYFIKVRDCLIKASDTEEEALFTMEGVGNVPDVYFEWDSFDSETLGLGQYLCLNPLTGTGFAGANVFLNGNKTSHLSLLTPSTNSSYGTTKVFFSNKGTVLYDKSGWVGGMFPQADLTTQNNHTHSVIVAPQGVRGYSGAGAAVSNNWNHRGLVGPPHKANTVVYAPFIHCLDAGPAVAMAVGGGATSATDRMWVFGATLKSTGGAPIKATRRSLLYLKDCFLTSTESTEVSFRGQSNNQGNDDARPRIIAERVVSDLNAPVVSNSSGTDFRYGMLTGSITYQASFYPAETDHPNYSDPFIIPN